MEVQGSKLPHEAALSDYQVLVIINASQKIAQDPCYRNSTSADNGTSTAKLGYQRMKDSGGGILRIHHFLSFELPRYILPNLVEDRPVLGTTQVHLYEHSQF